MKEMQLNAGQSQTNEQRLRELKEELTRVLGEIDKIRPIQFLDWESEYVYHFLGLMESEDEDRVWICISSEYDNLPAHDEARRQQMKTWRGEVAQPLQTERLI